MGNKNRHNQQGINRPKQPKSENDMGSKSRHVQRMANNSRQQGSDIKMGSKKHVIIPINEPDPNQSGKSIEEQKKQAELAEREDFGKMVGVFRKEKKNKNKGNGAAGGGMGEESARVAAGTSEQGEQVEDQAGAEEGAAEELPGWHEAPANLRQEHIDLLHKFNSHIGRLRKVQDELAAQQQKIAGYENSPRQGGVVQERPWTEAWNRLVMQGNYRDFLAPLEQRLQFIEAALEDFGKFARSHQECVKLEREHPDYGSIVNEQPFLDWLEQQPTPIREVVERNAYWLNSSDDVIWLLNEFKKHRDGQVSVKAERDKRLQQKRNLQVQSGAAVPSRGPGAGEDLPDNFGKQVEFFRNEMRTKGRTR
ncbi:MAG: hypothetical protein HQL65_14925 [Magnetococcales bacterium]|nr:hypothetical protein [Magnetococcales bacterium]